MYSSTFVSLTLCINAYIIQRPRPQEKPIEAPITTKAEYGVEMKTVGMKKFKKMHRMLPCHCSC